jgi:hypothetical protein
MYFNIIIAPKMPKTLRKSANFGLTDTIIDMKKSVKKSPTKKSGAKTSSKLGGFKLTPNAMMWSSLFLLALVSLLWIHFYYFSPQRVFNAMLNNSFRTTGLTRSIEEDNMFQNINRVLAFQTVPEPIIRGYTEVIQGENVQVLAENIGTPNSDYIRYVEIADQQETGDPTDYSQILDIWSFNRVASDDLLAEIYGDTVLGVIPFGNLNYQDRQELLELIRDNNVYAVDYGQARVTNENFRRKITYPVSVSPETYVLLLKDFASRVGIVQLEDVDPAQFAGAQPIEFLIEVDALTRQMVGLRSSGDGGQRNESFSNFGLVQDVRPPEQAISQEELQQRIETQ